MANDNQDAAAADPDDEALPKNPSRFYRHRWLFLMVGILIVLGPALSRLIASYRGIVLEIQDDTMLVGFAQRPPQKIDRIDAPPGSIVEKSAGAWSPAPAAPLPEDRDLQRLYARWAETYTGTIVEIMPPHNPKGVSTAIVETDDGRRVSVPLWSEHLAGAARDLRVEKRANRWDPDLLPTDAAPPVAPAARPPADPGGVAPLNLPPRK